MAKQTNCPHCGASRYIPYYPKPDDPVKFKCDCIETGATWTDPNRWGKVYSWVESDLNLGDHSLHLERVDWSKGTLNCYTSHYVSNPCWNECCEYAEDTEEVLSFTFRIPAHLLN